MKHKGTGCQKCSKVYKRNIDEIKSIIIEKCLEKGYTFVGFVGIYKNIRSKIKLLCNKHNSEWVLQCTNFISQNNGCPVCRKSKGEILIENYLKKEWITFIPQKKFIKCKNKRPLPFDYYLPCYNLCIEYDGIQHFEKANWWGEKTWKETMRNDKIKNKYCKNNNINLLRISYKENIIDKLKYSLGYEYAPVA